MAKLNSLFESLVHAGGILALVGLYLLTFAYEQIAIAQHVAATGHQPIFENGDESGEGRWICPTCGHLF